MVAIVVPEECVLRLRSRGSGMPERPPTLRRQQETDRVSSVAGLRDDYGLLLIYVVCSRPLSTERKGFQGCLRIVDALQMYWWAGALSVFKAGESIVYVQSLYVCWCVCMCSIDEYTPR